MISTQSSKPKPVRYYVERSACGRFVYIRPERNRPWITLIEPSRGSQWVFQEIEPGTGAYYELKQTE